MRRSISLITLGVSDYERAAAFYAALGWSPALEIEETAFFITREPAETFYGGYAGVFRDLDGHAWEIAHNPGFGLAPDGSIVLPQPTHDQTWRATPYGTALRSVTSRQQGSERWILGVPSDHCL